MIEEPIYKKLSNNGRIAIPAKLTKFASFNTGDSIMFILYQGSIILTKYTPNAFKRNIIIIGAVQKLDYASRVTIPVELRDELNLSEGSSFEIKTLSNAIVLLPVDKSSYYNEVTIKNLLNYATMPVNDELYIYKTVITFGRLKFGKELRELLNISSDKAFQFSIENDQIVLNEFQEKLNSSQTASVTGFSRQVDTIGRLVIPKKLREHLNIDIGDIILIHKKNDQLKILKPSQEKINELIYGISNSSRLE